MISTVSPRSDVETHEMYAIRKQKRVIPYRRGYGSRAAATADFPSKTREKENVTASLKTKKTIVNRRRGQWRACPFYVNVQQNTRTITDNSRRTCIVYTYARRRIYSFQRVSKNLFIINIVSRRRNAPHATRTTLRLFIRVPRAKIYTYGLVRVLCAILRFIRPAHCAAAFFVRVAARPLRNRKTGSRYGRSPRLGPKSAKFLRPYDCCRWRV